MDISNPCIILWKIICDKVCLRWRKMLHDKSIVLTMTISSFCFVLFSFFFFFSNSTKLIEQAIKIYLHQILPPPGLFHKLILIIIIFWSESWLSVDLDHKKFEHRKGPTKCNYQIQSNSFKLQIQTVSFLQQLQIGTNYSGSKKIKMN